MCMKPSSKLRVPGSNPGGVATKSMVYSEWRATGPSPPPEVTERGEVAKAGRSAIARGLPVWRIGNRYMGWRSRLLAWIEAQESTD